MASPWFPIVWGRTLETDTWWRTIPPDLEVAQLNPIVEGAVIANWAELGTPRYLLARRFGFWVTGVTCAARKLSRTMTADVEKRPLDVFVGWAAPVGLSTPPLLSDFETRYPDWAGPVYETWMHKDWTLSPADLRYPRRSNAVEPPWMSTDEPTGGDDPILDEQQLASTVLKTRPGIVELFPGRYRDDVWAAGCRSRDPFVLVVGWSGERKVPLKFLTHACVSSVGAHTEVRVDGGVDLSAEESVPEEEQSEVGSGGAARRTGWWPWQRGREDVEHLEAEVVQLRERIIAIEREVGQLRHILEDRQECTKTDSAALE